MTYIGMTKYSPGRNIGRTGPYCNGLVFLKKYNKFIMTDAFRNRTCNNSIDHVKPGTFYCLYIPFLVGAFCIIYNFYTGTRFCGRCKSISHRLVMKFIHCGSQCKFLIFSKAYESEQSFKE